MAKVEAAYTGPAIPGGLWTEPKMKSALPPGMQERMDVGLVAGTTMGDFLSRDDLRKMDARNYVGGKIENACYCENAPCPCPFWVAQNGRDRLDNLDYLQRANDCLLHGDVIGCLMAQQAWFGLERRRCGRMIAAMQAHGVPSVTYAECCRTAEAYEKLLLDRYIRLVGGIDV